MLSCVFIFISIYIYIFNIVVDHLPRSTPTPPILCHESVTVILHVHQTNISPIHLSTTQVITVGGSYSGNLAAWFKVKYPHLSDGSVASSAPVTAQTNFTGYMDVVADSLVYFSGLVVLVKC